MEAGQKKSSSYYYHSGRRYESLVLQLHCICRGWELVENRTELGAI